jgi:alginate O-acetyltransferase complex protein AlgI
MVFSSIIFLNLFLPFVLITYVLSPKQAKNMVLLAASLLFYAWGEGIFILVMVWVILTNYVFGRLIGSSNSEWLKNYILGVGIASNILLLGYFKYALFLVLNLNLLFDQPISTEAQIHLPIGISFFTFQAMSYLIDVYREETKAQKNLFDLALYISLFPQLIAGPIVRYRDITSNLKDRKANLSDIAEGVFRFAIGLGKKVLIANQVGLIADTVFGTEISEIGSIYAWLGAISYALQIYYDFSGYSDMAIGLGKIFGFHFQENFNYPYVVQSVQQFWRRWHISLSTWFRDYLYIPLGGNQKGVARTYFNLYIVFIITGLWHGASWNFVFWGLWHGTFLVIERLGANKILDKLIPQLRHLYAFLVIIIGWVFFRTETLDLGLKYSLRLFQFVPDSFGSEWYIILTNERLFWLVLGIVFAIPLQSWKDQFGKTGYPAPVLKGSKLWAARLALTVLLLSISFVYISTNSYNPFIYFRF